MFRFIEYYLNLYKLGIPIDNMPNQVIKSPAALRREKTKRYWEEKERKRLEEQEKRIRGETEAQIQKRTIPKSMAQIEGKTFVGLSAKDVADIQEIENKIAAREGREPLQVLIGPQTRTFLTGEPERAEFERKKLIEIGLTNPKQLAELDLTTVEREEIESAIASMTTEKQQEFINKVREEEQKLAPSQLEQQVITEGGLEQPQGTGGRFFKRAAEVGLVLPVSMSNLISDITGQDWRKTTVGEMADTELGMKLGITTAVVGAMALSATAWVMTGRISTALAGGVASGMGLNPSMIKGVGLTAATVVTGLSLNTIADIFLKREKLEPIKGAINTAGQRSGDIVSLARNNGITKYQAIAELNQLERDLNILEAKGDEAARLDIRVRYSGEYIDFQMDIEDARGQFRTARAEIINMDTEFNAAEITAILENMQAQQDLRKEDVWIQLGEEMLRKRNKIAVPYGQRKNVGMINTPKTIGGIV